MSLETVLEQTTAALAQHTEVMKALLARLGEGAALAVAGGAVAATPKPAPAPVAAPGAATAAAPAADAPTKTADASSPAAASAATERPGSTAVEAVTYEQVKPLVTKLSADKGREVAVAALAKFGVARGPELKPEQYAEFIAHAKELLA